MQLTPNFFVSQRVIVFLPGRTNVIFDRIVYSTLF